MSSQLAKFFQKSHEKFKKIAIIIILINFYNNEESNANDVKSFLLLPHLLRNQLQ